MNAALNNLGGGGVRQPLANDAIIAGMTQSVPGQLLDVTWSWATNPNQLYMWHGEFLGVNRDANNNVVSGNVRFATGQRGMPRSSNAAIDVTIPYQGVTYFAITYGREIPVEMQALFEAQNAEEANGPVQEPDLNDVSTWTMINNPPMGGEMMRGRVRQHAGHHVNSSQKRKMAVDLVTSWISCAESLQEWENSEPYIALGNLIMTNLRLILAEEVQKVKPEDVLRQVAKDDATDPLGQAIAKLSALAKPKPKTAWKGKCNFCGFYGHYEESCRKKKAAGQAPGAFGGQPTLAAKNGVGKSA